MHRHLIFTAVLVTLVSCASARFDPASERLKLLHRDAAWSDAAAQKDIERTLSYWSEDAVVMPPGQPVLEGKKAIREFVGASFQTPGFSIRWQSMDVRFSPDGKIAYMRGTNEMTVPGTKGEPATLHGRGFTVWRLEFDGEWRCVVDIWNAPVDSLPTR